MNFYPLTMLVFAGLSLLISNLCAQNSPNSSSTTPSNPAKVSTTTPPPLAVHPTLPRDFKPGIPIPPSPPFTPPAAVIPTLNPIPKDWEATKAAALKGDVKAEFEIGKIYFTGQGVDRNFLQTFAWFKKAADQGHAESAHNLGVLYYNGLGAPRDPVNAVKWYRVAAEEGLAPSETVVGSFYASGYGGIPKDLNMAVSWLNKAVAQKFLRAELDLAQLYYFGDPGLGQKIDYDLAFKYYTLASEQKSIEAQNALGVMYRAGTGTKQDLGKSVELFTAAAEQGDPKAQSNLAGMYYYGRGVEKDLVQAYKWWYVSANAMEQTAIKCLNERHGAFTKEQIEDGERLANLFKPKASTP